MARILIVEDQVLIANHIKNILLESDYTTIEMAFNIQEATVKLNEFSPDIILLDINIEGPDTGIEWAKSNLNFQKVIFITAQTEMETLKKALKIQPIAYLTKPVKTIDLIAAIEVANDQLKTNTIIIKDGYTEIKLLLDDILFIKSDKNYIDIFTASKTYTIRTSLDCFFNDLDKSIFQKVHRSYVVNKNKIHTKTSSFLQISKYEIPISRNIDFNF